MRIRTIKPEFWKSDDIAALSWEDRLLFIGLWSYVDDNGVGRDSEKLIVAELFPLEDNYRDTLATVSRGLQTLFEAGLITRYVADGKSFLYINTWSSNQKIDRPGKARYPLPDAESSVLATLSRHSRDSLAAGSGNREQGTGNREQGRTDQVPVPIDAEKEPMKSTADKFDEWWPHYPKKADKGAARRAFTTAMKKTDLPTLIAAADAYAAIVDPRFIKNPATWLNAESWDNDVQKQPELKPVPGEGEAWMWG